MATALASADTSRSPGRTTVRWVDCSHKLGSLPCMNHKPHQGNGRGCVHHSTSGFQDDE
ncbi:hypothetical protein [Pimelobacter simplex]|uniref:hypothetical protein n=1 Tax=Nocardioides simplex TaxID=2045 RepID=UPI0021501D81|nr:hypothetical protein [Pimelobacter simplex]UUW88603.1 hypothetical protein M0M43_23105 [Pimelobacter simplex]UUW98108.1 hypothetical protein M0M48_11755 [Pimelobacter simplex]